MASTQLPYWLQEKPTLDPNERSHYLPWIKKDLQPWHKRGIRQVTRLRCAMSGPPSNTRMSIVFLKAHSLLCPGVCLGSSHCRATPSAA